MLLQHVGIIFEVFLNEVLNRQYFSFIFKTPETPETPRSFQILRISPAKTPGGSPPPETP